MKKIQNLAFILDLLSHDEWMQFDPENKIDTSHFPKVTFLATDFNEVLDLEEIQGSQELMQLTQKILLGSSFTNEKIFLPGNELVEIIKAIKGYVDKKYSDKTPAVRALKYDALEFAFSRIIAARMYKEIRYQDIPCPFKRISEEERDESFHQLQTKLQTESLKQFGQQLPSSTVGQEVTRFYTDKDRLLVANDRSKSNILDIWNSIKLLPFIANQIRILISEKRAIYVKHNANKADNNEDNIKYSQEANTSFQDFSSNRMAHRLTRYYGVTNYQPILVGLLIKFLQDKYPNISIENMLDLCSGWGDRLVGSLAASSLGLKRYVGVDPQETLHVSYSQIAAQFSSPGFSSAFYASPMENCSPEQLAPGNRPNQLMMTCPPYFNLENYNGINQSHTKYDKYSVWKERFLYKLIDQSTASLQAGGFIAIHLGKCKNLDLTQDLKHYVQSLTYLRYLGDLQTKVKGTALMVMQFKGDFQLYAPVTYHVENTANEQAKIQAHEVQRGNPLTFFGNTSATNRDASKQLEQAAPEQIQPLMPAAPVEEEIIIPLPDFTQTMSEDAHTNKRANKEQPNKKKQRGSRYPLISNQHAIEFYTWFATLPEQLEIPSTLVEYARQLYRYHRLNEPQIQASPAYQQRNKVELNPNRVLIPFSGGIDSTAAILWAQEKNYDIYLLHINVLNFSTASVEREAAIQVARQLGLEDKLIITQQLPGLRKENNKLKSLKLDENPAKNQFIWLVALEYMRTYGCGQIIMPAQDDGPRTHFSDTISSCDSFLPHAQSLLGEHGFVVPFRSKKEYVELIMQRDDLKNLVSSCFTGAQFRQTHHNKNKDKLPIWDNECGVCSKCKRLIMIRDEVAAEHAQMEVDVVPSADNGLNASVGSSSLGIFAQVPSATLLAPQYFPENSMQPK